MPPPTAKKSRATRKNPTTKDNKRDEDEGDVIVDAPGPAITTPAKKRGPRKTAAARKAEAESANANDAMEDVDQPAPNPADESNPVTAEQNSIHEADRSVIKDKRGGNKPGRKNEAKEKPRPQVW